MRLHALPDVSQRQFVEKVKKDEARPKISANQPKIHRRSVDLRKHATTKNNLSSKIRDFMQVAHHLVAGRSLAEGPSGKMTKARKSRAVISRDLNLTSTNGVSIFQA